MSKQLLNTSKFGLVDQVVSLMHEVENFIEMDGKQKKLFVLDHMKERIKDTEFGQEYEEIIDNLVEFVIAISKNKYDLNLNKITKCCIIV